MRRHRLYQGKSERAAVMVEGALVFPLVMLFIFGVIQGALLFRTYLSANNASDHGARAASVGADNDSADYSVLQGVARSAMGADVSQIKAVIVFKASSSSSTAPTACVALANAPAHPGGSSADFCNVYYNDDLSVDKTTFEGAGYSRDNYWPASERNVSQSSSDYAGVWVLMDCDCSALSFFGHSSMLTATSVNRIEPAIA